MQTLKRFVGLVFLCAIVCGCQLGYLVNNAYHQGRLLKRAVPIENVLEDATQDAETKRKLRLAQSAKDFAEKILKLKSTDNYSTFVQLEGPYVTYVVSAAPKNELTYYTWWFPIVGSVPYKGYFRADQAQKMAQELQKENYDTYVRGVSAFSTLGWFRDPVLSSMLSYQDIDLVNTIIHETVHATIYISSNANFNERLATFLGDLGTQLYYKQQDPKILGAIENHLKNEDLDQRLFSKFISEEIKKLETWYAEHKTIAKLLQEREKKFLEIQQRFKNEIKSQLKTKRYQSFDTIKLNNARLLGFKLYMNDLSDFEKLYKIFDGDFEKILSYCKSLEKQKDPEKSLQDFVSQVR